MFVSSAKGGLACSGDDALVGIEGPWTKETLESVAFAWVNGGGFPKALALRDAELSRVAMPGSFFIPLDIGLDPVGADYSGEAQMERARSSMEEETHVEQVEDLDGMIAVLVERMADQLGLQISAISANANLMELGADSIHLMQLLRWLKAEIDGETTMQELAGTETIAALAQILWSRRLAGSGMVGQIAAKKEVGEKPQLSREEAEAMLDRLDGMSESELIETLGALPETKEGAHVDA
jgi:aryl carrier-like protein